MPPAMVKPVRVAEVQLARNREKVYIARSSWVRPRRTERLAGCVAAACKNFNDFFSPNIQHTCTHANKPQTAREPRGGNALRCAFRIVWPEAFDGESDCDRACGKQFCFSLYTRDDGTETTTTTTVTTAIGQEGPRSGSLTLWVAAEVSPIAETKEFCYVSRRRRRDVRSPKSINVDDEVQSS